MALPIDSVAGGPVFPDLEEYTHDYTAGGNIGMNTKWPDQLDSQFYTPQEIGMVAGGEGGVPRFRGTFDENIGFLKNRALIDFQRRLGPPGPT